jgi:hypothetical protein
MNLLAKLSWLARWERKNPDALIHLGPAKDDLLLLGQAFANILIFGQVGSGKTTGIGAALAYSLLLHHSRPGFFVACQKPDEAERWLRYSRQCGRFNDVIHVKPGGRHTIDILDFETSCHGGGVEQAESLLGIIMEVANRNKTRNSADSFWPESAQRQMRFAMMIIRMAGIACGLRELMMFCMSLPTTPEQLKDPKWRKDSFAVNCLLGASENFPNDPTLEMAGEWLVKEWPELSDKTRSIIQSVTLTTLDKLLTSQFADLLNGETTFRPEEVLRDGKIVIWDCPGSVYGLPAILSTVSMKVLFQRACMRRDLSKQCRPFVLWTDEAANFCVPDVDAMFLSQSRQFKCICVNIVQNIPLIVTALGGNDTARNQAHAWISNHSLIVGAANSDPETNKHLSALAGEERETLYGGSSGGMQQFDLLDDFMGIPTSNVTANWNQTFRPALPPERFLDLAKGGKESGFIQQAYVFQSGRKFSNGKTWIKGAWKQKF